MSRGGSSRQLSGGREHLDSDERPGPDRAAQGATRALPTAGSDSESGPSPCLQGLIRPRPVVGRPAGVTAGMSRVWPGPAAAARAAPSLEGRRGPPPPRFDRLGTAGDSGRRWPSHPPALASRRPGDGQASCAYVADSMRGGAAPLDFQTFIIESVIEPAPPD